MFHKFDIWVGKTLFIPLAIRICQQFKFSQYALHTYIWLVVWLTWVWDGPADHSLIAWIWYTVICIFALIWTVVAAVAPDGQMKTSLVWIRTMWWALFVLWIFISLPVDIISHHQPFYTDIYNGGRDWFILLAEYALCITKIPPLEKREKAPKAKLARQQA